jgi:hypothetical protein
MKINKVTFLFCLLAGLLVLGCGEDGGGGDTDGDVEIDVEEDAEIDADAVEDVLEDGDEDVEADVDYYWEAFLEGRETYLRDLSVPILDCVSREDTTNPCFHGCMDWHSSVEGVWALIALTRVLGDTSFEETANAILNPTDVAAELAQLESGGPSPTEIPYGYSWFMKLAIEREQSGESDLLPHAVLIADALETHLRGLTMSDINVRLTSDDYLNLSWTVFNLWSYAVWAADWELADWLEVFTRTEILSREDLCPLRNSYVYTRDFFPPCLHRARVLTKVLPPAEAAAWLETNLPADFDLEPIVEPENIHAAGLNFSRTWGLYALWEATGERKFRDMYVEHIETHMAMPEYWRDDYDRYAHWVPNFGVYSILLSYE